MLGYGGLQLRVQFFVVSAPGGRLHQSAPQGSETTFLVHHRNKINPLLAKIQVSVKKRVRII